MTDGNHQSIRCPHCGKVAATVSVVVADQANEANGKYVITPSTSIGAYPWPVRIGNVFKHFARLEQIDGKWGYVDLPIKTFADLCSVADYELLRMPNCGQKSITEIKDVLADYGLHLAESDVATG